MIQENKKFTFKVEDIFEDIPDDSENVNMNIPQEVADAIGLLPGDELKISFGDQGTIIIEKLDQNS